MEAALVGYGYWGQVLLPILKSLEDTLDYSLSFVCDRNQSHSEILKNQFPAIKIYSDATSDNWRFGTLRMDIQPDGRR